MSGLRQTGDEPHPAHGVQQLWLLRSLDLAAQIAHVDIQGVGVTHERCTPDAFQDLQPRLHLAAVPHEVGEQIEFPLRERQLPLAPLHLPFDQVDA